MPKKTDERAGRRAELAALFEDIDERERVLVANLIDVVVDLEIRMKELRQLPFLISHPTKPGIMKTTPASRQYKEASAAYMNGVRILLSVLRNAGGDEESELLKKLEEFA